MSGPIRRHSQSSIDLPALTARIVAAVGGGIAWGLLFGEHSRGWLAWVALVPLIWLLGLPRGGRWGLLHGFVAWLVALSWLVETVVVFGGLPTLAAWPAVGLLCLYLGAFHGVFVGLGRRLWGRRAWVAMLGLPSLWVTLEHLRSWLLGGFPWNLAAYAWVDLPGALELSAWVGAWGVSWLLVFANVTVGWGALRRRGDLVAVGFLAPLALLAAAGRWAIPTPAAVHGRAEKGLAIEIVQPNLPIRDLDAETLESSYRKVIAMADRACPPPRPAGSSVDDGPVIILPESATWPYDFHTSARLRRDLAAISERGCPLILNSTLDEGEGLRNVALLVARGSIAARYDKRHLVPFGEYVPFAGLLPFVETLARNAGTFTAGDQPALLDWREERMAMAICYEVTHAAAIAEQVEEGATVLTTITNDAWYGDTWAPWQHFRAVRFRAAENRRPMLRAALTGVSAVIDSRGRVSEQLGVGEEGVLSAWVTGRSDLSPYTRSPRLVPLASTLTALILLGSAIILARRGDRSHRATRPPVEPQAR